jgi:hypothetical protein
MVDYLTHERLNHKFRNNFDLTNYAINFAKRSVVEGAPKYLAEVLRVLEALPDIEEKEQGLSYA